MSEAGGVSLDEAHPLVLELDSLRQAVAHFQNEAHKANQQVQHLSLQNIEINQKCHAQERERDALLREIGVFRDTTPSLAASSRDALQVQELTISLRRLSDKLDLADEELLRRNEEIVRANSDRSLALKLESATHENLEPLRIDLEKKAHEIQDLTRRLRSEEEQRKLTDKALEQYADLVRSLEGRRTGDSQSNRASVDNFKHARLGLDKLLRDSNADSEKLHREIGRLHDSLEKMQMQLRAEKDNGEELKQSLAAVHLLLQKVERDDKAAAKMVSRYMKFSQTSTDVLHKAIESQKKRQEALISSYETRIKDLEDSSFSERRHFEQLQRAFEEVTEDISRESFGRRREVALRLSLLAREEALAERLRRWLLRARENSASDESKSIIDPMLLSAEEILRDLDDLHGQLDSVDNNMSSLARILAAESNVKLLQNELRRETDLRLFYQRQLTLGSRTRRAVSFTPKSISSKLRLAEMVSISHAPAVCNSDSQNPKSEVSLKDNTYHERDRVLEVEDSEVPSDMAKDGDLQQSGHDATGGSAPTFPQAESSVVEGRVIVGGQSSLQDLMVEEKAEDIVAPGPDGPLLSASQSESEIPDVHPSTNGAIASDGGSPGESTNAYAFHNDDGVSLDEDEQTAMPQEGRQRMNAEYNTTADLAPILLINEEPGSDPTLDQASKFSDILRLLATSQDRYISLQTGFRDCHLALQEMKSSSFETSTLSKSAVSLILERLSDHCEDARVELEIRVADEERIAKGYETVLLIPNALENEVSEQDFLVQVEAFVSGSDPSVSRARDSLNHKLEDLQHDIAAVKCALAGASPLLTPQEVLPIEEKPRQSGWSAWTGSILAPSRTSSPAPSFGAVMTSPRLRRSPSSASLRQESSVHTASPIASLGLRIPMPSDIPHRSETQQSSPLTMQRGAPRPRVVSNVLGLGFKGGLLPTSRGPSSFSSDSLSRATAAPSNLYLNDDVE